MREDFNVEEFLDAELPQNDPSHPISKTQTREWVHLAIHIAIGIIFGVACTFVLVPFFRKSNSRGDYPECWAILQSATLVNKFPLPLEVNRSAHQAAHMSLDFSHERIEPVIDIRSKVVEKLTFMRAAFVRHLPHTIYMFYQPDRKAAIATVRGDILSAHNYLKEAAAQVEVLTDYYNGMRAAYNGLHASARAELYHAQMNDKQAGYVKWWSDLVSFFHGHTAEYKKRLGEASRMVEEADSGLVALNEEVQRLERINRVINEVARILKVMLELIDKGAFEENNRRDCELRPSRIRPKAWLIWILQRLRIWNVPKTKDGYCQPSLLTAFQSHILENRSLKRYWKELDQFIKEGEASLTIDIKPDWYRGSFQLNLTASNFHQSGRLNHVTAISSKTGPTLLFSLDLPPETVRVDNRTPHTALKTNGTDPSKKMKPTIQVQVKKGTEAGQGVELYLCRTGQG